MCVVTRVTCVQALPLIHTHLQVGMQQPKRTGSSGSWLTGRSVTQGRGPLQTCFWESGVLSEPASSLLLSAVSSVPHTKAAGHNYSCALFATLCGGVHTLWHAHGMPCSSCIQEVTSLVTPGNWRVSLTSPHAPSRALSMLMLTSALFSFRCSLMPPPPHPTPGSSIQDPTYAGAGLPHSKTGAALPDAKITRPSKKAQWLRLSTKHAR